MQVVGSVTLLDKAGSEFTTTVVAEREEQPANVTVTEYEVVLDGDSVITAVAAPVFQT
jgi:hypothetical protein